MRRDAALRAQLAERLALARCPGESAEELEAALPCERRRALACVARMPARELRRAARQLEEARQPRPDLVELGNLAEVMHQWDVEADALARLEWVGRQSLAAAVPASVCESAALAGAATARLEDLLRSTRQAGGGGDGDDGDPSDVRPLEAVVESPVPGPQARALRASGLSPTEKRARLRELLSELHGRPLSEAETLTHAREWAGFAQALGEAVAETAP